MFLIYRKAERNLWIIIPIRKSNYIHKKPRYLKKTNAFFVSLKILNIQNYPLHITGKKYRSAPMRENNEMY